MKRIRIITVIVLLLGLTGLSFSSMIEDEENVAITVIDHNKFDVLLKKHVSSAGKVNYAGFKRMKS